MASSKEYLQYILDQLSELEDITTRAMMGEFIIYYKGKIAGEICDNRLLVKPVKSALEYVTEVKYELPYEGAKNKLLHITETDSKEYLTGLFRAIYDELPESKKKKK
ncbi:MAG: TfoX/Sxy family protein [Porcipelethomonas sp.]